MKRRRKAAGVLLHDTMAEPLSALLARHPPGSYAVLPVAMSPEQWEEATLYGIDSFEKRQQAEELAAAVIERARLRHFTAAVRGGRPPTRRVAD